MSDFLTEEANLFMIAVLVTTAILNNVEVCTMQYWFVGGPSEEGARAKGPLTS
jgi:hypothetical protein